ncbi:hypothetical protein BDB00DRAFT_849723 [Zychaea mexicana]|uniref:uncharacterized protein n=1 Tax=Zychaea mexicana TaxID=64656 RepID=UPI0022FDEAF5|nr:uncharacterized protein BDB00DRAFT_849723 [Zychaea mexicana]KAI9488120.1 hypothetical protein BDB00DRAFT_849723 [Zychaea mexicana]
MSLFMRCRSIYSDFSMLASTNLFFRYKVFTTFQKYVKSPFWKEKESFSERIIITINICYDYFIPARK